MKALVIVDVQNDFLPGGALAVPHGDEIVPLINRLMRHFPIVVATADWHPTDHCSFASNHPGKREYDEIHWDGTTQTLWPVHCIAETHGAELAEGLESNAVQQIFHKGTSAETDSYSGFVDQRGGAASGLGEFLKSKGVTEVYLAGLATDYCVKATALDSVKLGYRTLLIADACRGVDAHRGDVVQAITEMRRAGVEVIATRDVEKGESFLEKPLTSTVMAAGKFAKLVQRGRWEFVERTKASGVVIIVPITDDGHYVFVEQYRVPVAARCIEFPAGLAGDIPEYETEALATAAQRELLEETGFEARTMTRLTDASSSAGLTSEIVTFFRATQLSRHGSGGGVESEDILVHVIPQAKVNHWLAEQANQGAVVAAKVYAGLWLATTTP